MFKLELQWKDFSVDLEAMEKTLKAAHPTYVGNQASSKLELFFSEDLAQAAVDQITAEWEALTTESPIAKSFRTQKQVMDALQIAKEGVVTKTWDTMSAIERKLVMNMPVTKDELIAAKLL